MDVYEQKTSVRIKYALTRSVMALFALGQTIIKYITNFFYPHPPPPPPSYYFPFEHIFSTLRRIVLDPKITPVRRTYQMTDRLLQ